MIYNAIARRYAKALVQLGSENNLIDRFSQELTVVDRLFADSDELRLSLETRHLLQSKRNRSCGT